MSLAIQQDLFDNPSEIDMLRTDLFAVKKSNDNVRRGMFARHNELMKLILEQRQQIEELKSQLIVSGLVKFE